LSAAAFASWPRPLREAAIVLLVGAGLGALGPFGTFGDLGPAPRYGYWLILTFLMWVQLWAAHVALGRFEVLRRAPVLAGIAAVALVGAVPTTFEVAWVEGLLRVERVLSPRAMAETYACVALVALGLWTPLRLIDRRGPAPAPVPSEAGTPFLSRVPSRLGRRLTAVAAEDHYLRVHTPRGSDLVHGRLSDAVQDLGDAGVQVHRSWWVARDAVERVEREGDRVTLVLIDGVRAPVSRTYLLAAREAGLIADRD
jgi:hypothetical protein